MTRLRDLDPLDWRAQKRIDAATNWRDLSNRVAYRYGIDRRDVDWAQLCDYARMMLDEPRSSSYQEGRNNEPTL